MSTFDKRKKRNVFAGFMATACLGLALLVQGCAGADLSVNDDGTPKDQEGPHAAADRKLAELEVEETAAGTTIAHFDLGNTEVGAFRAPVRGVLATPAAATQATADNSHKLPLLIVNHLRYPGCDDGNFAYPCAANAKERRFDEGMIYFAEAMAAEGYAVLIPDLSPAWVGSDLKSPYDQDTMWQQTIAMMLAELNADPDKSALAAKTGADRIDTDSIGLVLHSRSGTLTNPAAELLGAENIKGVLAYGPAYDTYDSEHMSADIADIPYMAITGDEDQDVGSSANLWRGYYLGESRTQPALVASVPGFGHTLINRALHDFDDRIGCEDAARKCPDAAAHEKLLTGSASEWFKWVFAADSIQAATDSDLPLTAAAAIPDELSGISARWLVASNAHSVNHLQPEDFKALEGHSALFCIPADPMNPNRAENACPEPDNGVVDIAFATKINLLDGASVQVDNVKASGFAIHLAPFGTSDPPSGTNVTLTFEFSNGATYEVVLDPAAAALRNRADENSNGYYLLSTVREQLPAQLQQSDISAVRITADRKVMVAGIDLIAAD